VYKFGQAIVIGGSIAGLITGRVLSDFFGQVTILERDQIEDGPVVHKSIPQGNHLHALLQGGQQILASLYPGFAEDLRKLGAAAVTMGRDVAWYLPDGKAYNPTGSLRQPRDLGFEGHCASRGLIEFAIRRRTLAFRNVRVETGITVRELVHRPVTFRYKGDPQATKQYGRVAEEGERQYPELVTRSADGQVQSVRYSMLTSMLLNELQKERRETQREAWQLRRQAGEIGGEAEQIKRLTAIIRILNRPARHDYPPDSGQSGPADVR
jgi:2-polyprenyl-6-methoxyphenol hydroxylase-like FAD-dependent oxidoreductase